MKQTNEIFYIRSGDGNAMQGKEEKSEKKTNEKLPEKI